MGLFSIFKKKKDTKPSLSQEEQLLSDISYEIGCVEDNIHSVCYDLEDIYDCDSDRFDTTDDVIEEFEEIFITCDSIKDSVDDISSYLSKYIREYGVTEKIVSAINEIPKVLTNSTKELSDAKKGKNNISKSSGYENNKLSIIKNKVSIALNKMEMSLKSLNNVYKNNKKYLNK